MCVSFAYMASTPIIYLIIFTNNIGFYEAFTVEVNNYNRIKMV